MRWPAAIGLSEITDAVIVVVSEETGAVSVAFQEELHRGLDAAATRAAFTFTGDCRVMGIGAVLTAQGNQ